MMETIMIGIIGMPAIAPAAATAMRIGVPGIRTPSTATASMIAAENAIRIASIGYCAARSAAPLIKDHTLRFSRRGQHRMSPVAPWGETMLGKRDEWKHIEVKIQFHVPLTYRNVRS